MGNFLYVDIASSLRGRIERGDFEGGKLPSERELLVEYRVQRATVRRALKTLEAEGLIFRDTTRGTFLARRSDRVASIGQATELERGGFALVVGRADDTTAPGDIARGLAQVARADERFLVWFDTPALPGHAEAEAPDPCELTARGVVGCVLWPQIPASVERLRKLRDAMPVVLLDRRVPGFESDFVGINDVAAARRVVEHLLTVGHRRIGFVAIEPHVATVQSRMRGWASGLMAADIKPQDRWILTQTQDFSEADDPLFERLLSGENAPTALLCTNDTIAAQVIRFLRASGRQVGTDVAVTGFGNAFPGLLDALGLTTIAQPWDNFGVAAGEILAQRLYEKATQPGNPNPVVYREVELPAQLVVRRSCGIGTFRPPQ